MFDYFYDFDQKITRNEALALLRRGEPVSVRTIGTFRYAYFSADDAVPF